MPEFRLWSNTYNGRILSQDICTSCGIQLFQHRCLVSCEALKKSSLIFNSNSIKVWVPPKSSVRSAALYKIFRYYMASDLALGAELWAAKLQPRTPKSFEVANMSTNLLPCETSSCEDRQRKNFRHLFFFSAS